MEHEKRKIGLILVITWLALLVIRTILSSFLDAVWQVYEDYIYMVIAYAIILILLGLEIDHLVDFNIDKLALLLLIFGTIIRTEYGIPQEYIFKIALFLLGIMLAILAISRRRSIPRTNLNWVVIAIIASFILLYPLTLVERIYIDIYKSSLDSQPWVAIIVNVIHQVSFVSLHQEFLFRCFIWGYLRKMNWSENRIMIIQAFLFWILHYQHLATPLSFLISIPITTLLFSLLTRFSKQGSPSMIAHIITNALIPIMVNFYLP